MVHIAKLANFRADHQVSPVLDPDDWLDANAKQILGILHDFKAIFSDDQQPEDYTQTFGVNTMYPVCPSIFKRLTNKWTFLSGLRHLSSYNYPTKTEGKHFWISLSSWTRI